MKPLNRLLQLHLTRLSTHHTPSTSASARALSTGHSSSSSGGGGGDDEWNIAWETAWLPEDLSGKNRAPWESDVSFPAAPDANSEAKAFVAEMDERWSERRAAKQQKKPAPQKGREGNSMETVDEMKRDYRMRKQSIHAAMWAEEIEKEGEAGVGGSRDPADDIDRLLDSCSEIFDSDSIRLDDSQTPRTSDFKIKPDGWETTSKSQDGNVWEMSQREEDILLQEFERRIAFSKSQIASFIKSHIFSRRRPIDGWKYMIEELGPNAKRGKGGVQRMPALADPSTQPFKEDQPAITADLSSFRGR
ncbi:hypothetical protein QJS10_CPA06g00531 [Acorus calamus]|uniref:Mucin-like protein n=1 Tax=Acorus calamus TaxID=4465 RepID=A0AAV9EJP9_ACOCL|nr:hypothetical protein QJS10_CPA06g00531 [Acorus calamus]